jgi:hypothetical protein
VPVASTASFVAPLAGVVLALTHREALAVDRFGPPEQRLEMLTQLHTGVREVLVALLKENSDDRGERDPFAVVSDTEGPDGSELELAHQHLPMLEAMEFIGRDRGSRTARKGRSWGDVAPLLVLIRDHRDELPDDWGGPQTTHDIG